MLCKRYKYQGKLDCREEFGQVVVGARLIEIDTTGHRLDPNRMTPGDLWIATKKQVASLIRQQYENLEQDSVSDLHQAVFKKNIDDLEQASRALDNSNAKLQALENYLRAIFRPSFIRAPIKALVTKYLIEDGSVKICHSFLGIKYGKRPELPLESVTAVQASGLIWGNIEFKDISGEPVVWKCLFRPESVLKEVKKRIDTRKKLSDEMIG